VTNVIDESVEKEVLSRQKAKELADQCFRKPDPLMSRGINNSLLSAEHIYEYVMATGLISPFHMYGEKRRLKKASYEGRIGDKAYFFDSGVLKPAIFRGEFLQIPANSIVFVECDLDFRIPEYIALRFNLHIEHVHRGLLLGTGPLVDPGFRGKLCIPIHNLTSEDYEISRKEGLIWVEFTKTTSDVDPLKAKGAEPSNTEYWDILKFITKASKGVDGAKNVPIQSSIKGALLKFQGNAEAAKHAAISAKDASLAAEKQTKRLTVTGAIGTLGVILGGVALIYAAMSAINGQVQISKDYIDASEQKVTALLKEVSEDYASEEAGNYYSIDEAKSLLAELEVIKARLGVVEAEMVALSEGAGELTSNGMVAGAATAVGGR
jgi:deoxycytidine triphosphate deaminase